METKVASESIDIVRVFYYSYPRWGLLAKATADYQRCFGITPVIANHLAIQLGTRLYEVSMEGTTCHNFNDSLFDHDHSIFEHKHLRAFYECHIKDIDTEVKRAARFTLDHDVFSNRRLQSRPCLRYLSHWLTRNKSKLMYDYEIDFSLEPGNIRGRKFNLPYTCATQAAFVFSRLFGLEPILDSHLPTALLWLNMAMADNGIGQLYEAIDL